MIKLLLMLEAVKKAITPETAAILIEPIQGEGGISIAPMKILPEFRKLCNEKGLLLFLDKVRCGVGRSGELFAYEFTGVLSLDLMSIAKGVGGGFPTQAVFENEKVGEALRSCCGHATRLSAAILWPALSVMLCLM